MSTIILTKDANCNDLAEALVNITTPTQFLLVTNSSVTATILFNNVIIGKLVSSSPTFNVYAAGDYTVRILGQCAMATVCIDDILDEGASSNQIDSELLTACDDTTETVPVSQIVSVAGSERPLNVRVIGDCNENLGTLEDQTHVLTHGVDTSIPAGAKSAVVTNLTGTTTIDAVFTLGAAPYPTAISYGASTPDDARGLLPAITIAGGTWQWSAVLPIAEI